MTTNEISGKPSIAETFTPGQTVGESFTLKQKIATGDTGILWLAQDSESGKEVTLLFLPGVLLGDTRFLDELRIQVKQNRQLIHPNVVRTFDFVEEEGWAAISSEAVEAETLGALLAKKPQHAFDASEIKPWLATICQTLDDTHRANLLHRDLVPQNVLLTKEGRILLANLGTGRIILDALARTPARNKIDEHLATMSPQQLDGEHPARWDDIYSLGGLIYQLLTGKPPFHTGDILPQIRKTSPASISDRRTELGIKGGPVPLSWEKVVAACLEKHTPQRPKSAREVGMKISAEIPGSSTPAQAPAAVVVAETAATKPKKAAEPAKKPEPSKEALIEDIVWKKPAAQQRPQEEPGASASRKSLLQKVPDSPAEKKSGSKLPLVAGVCLAALVIYLLLPKGKPEQKTTTGATSPTPIVAQPKSTPAVAAPTVTKVDTAPTPAVTQPGRTPSMLLPSVSAEKMRSLELARKAVEETEKGLQAKTDAQQKAEADVAAVKTTVDTKSVALLAMNKTIADTANMRKDREEAERKATADAEEAQKALTEKSRIADEARKAKEQIQNQIKDQEDAKQKADAEIQALQKTAAEKQQAAADAAKAKSEAEAQLQQQQQALKQLETEVSQQSAIPDATPMDTQPLQSPGPMEMSSGTGLSSGTDGGLSLVPLSSGTGASSIEFQEKQLVLKAQGKQLPLEATPGGEAVPDTYARNPKSQIDKTMENSLGMKFKPVGDVLFCIWLVRVQDFDAFARSTHFKGNAWLQPGFKQGPDHPVVNVTWNDAVAFCKWLTDKEQKAGLLAPNQYYRLPSDMEWSKAVGLPDESGKTPESRDMDVTDVYPWGTQWPPPAGAGNYTGEETSSDVAIKGYDDGYGFTSPVGSFTVNKYGLYDMGGNAWQWCADWWNGEQKAKVLRGASWYNGGLKLSLLSSCRLSSAPDITTDNFGFRVILASDLKQKR